MKIKYLLLLLLISQTYYSSAQGVGINDDNSSPDPSAMLDVKSTSKGVLVPRMTTSQRMAVTNPATGLLVFDSDENSFWFFDGMEWKDFTSTWSTDGKNVFRDHGNVGIGLTIPETRLHVAKNLDGNSSHSNSQAIFAPFDASSSFGARISLLQKDLNPTGFASIGFWDTSNKARLTIGSSGGGSSIALSVNGMNQPEFLLNSFGNLGIGTLIPGLDNSSNPLYDPLDKIIEIKGATNKKAWLALGSDQQTQNEVVGGISFLNTFAQADDHRILGYIRARSTLVAGNATKGSLEFATKNNGVFDYTPDMVISDKGYLGIGTTIPESTLDVRGFAQIKTGSARLFLEESSSPPDTKRWAIKSFPDGGHSTFAITAQSDDDTAGQDAIRIKRSGHNISDIIMAGNVGIGASDPDSRLEVAGTIHSSSEGFKFPDGSIQATSATGKDDFRNGGEAGGADRTLGNTDDFDLGLLTNNSTRLHIQNDGKIGIGTTSPLTKLTLAGSDVDNGITFGPEEVGKFSLYKVPDQGWLKTNAILKINRISAHGGPNDLLLTGGSSDNGVIISGPSGSLASYSLQAIHNTPITKTNETVGTIKAQATLAPSSGDVQYFGLSIEPTINQSGTAHGNYTALKVDVTETSFLGSDGRLMDLGVDGSSHLVVKNNGKVGIGTAAPNSPLEVAGVIHSSADGFKFPDGTTQITAALTDDADPDPTNEIQNLSDVLGRGNDAGSSKITNLVDPTNPQDAATKNYVDSSDDVNDADHDPNNEFQNLSEVLSRGSNAGGSTITNVANPTNQQDAATKQYVDSSNELQDLSNVLSRGSHAGGLNISGLADPVHPQDAATKQYVINQQLPSVYKWTLFYDNQGDHRVRHRRTVTARSTRGSTVYEIYSFQKVTTHWIIYDPKRGEARYFVMQPIYNNVYTTRNGITEIKNIGWDQALFNELYEDYVF